MSEDRDTPIGGLIVREYRARIGHIYGDERTTQDAAKDAALDALADYPVEFDGRYDAPVVYERTVSAWTKTPTPESTPTQ